VGRAFPVVGTLMDGGDDRFSQAAVTYLAYGFVYLGVALYLQLRVFAVHGRALAWFGIGAVLALGVPWLLVRRRRWFERWVLSRRDFARILTLLVVLRTLAVGWIAWRGPGPRMALFGGGVPPSAAGAWVMAAIAGVTAAMLARAAWSPEESGP